MAGERMPAALEAAFGERLQEFAADDVGGRIWAADPTLWKPGVVAHQEIIANALGWVDVYKDVRDEIAELTSFVAGVHAEGFRSAVLLGMGGSSLAPEVFRDVLKAGEVALELHVLDSTDPAAVLAVEAAVDLDRTLFIVASKSGGTTETASFHAYFYGLLKAHCAEHAGSHFVAITDEGTSLEREAIEQGFRAIFVNPSDIGGRYSALSFFGLVPAALLGVDLERLLDGVDAMAAACGPDVPAVENPALRLGAAMGQLALDGRDKLTLVCEAPLAPLGAWIEQLVAESTGKEGVGVLPVDLEQLGSPEQYGDDRVFCSLRLAGAGDDVTGRLDALAEAGHPILKRELVCVDELGGEMLCWELASAAAGVVLDIDPFDQPNVQESKDRTKRLLVAYAADGTLPAAEGEGGAQLTYAVGDEGLPDALRVFLAQGTPGDYVALQAYVAPGATVWDQLQALRLQLRDDLRLATTAGFGPRYLHSTGQFHKGGPNRGLFLQLVGHDPRDVEIPGQPYGFRVLKRAQARGDLAALRAHDCRVLRVCLGDDASAGRTRLTGMIAAVLEHK